MLVKPKVRSSREEYGNTLTVRLSFEGKDGRRHENSVRLKVGHYQAEAMRMARMLLFTWAEECVARDWEPDWTPDGTGRPYVPRNSATGVPVEVTTRL